MIYEENGLHERFANLLLTKVNVRTKSEEVDLEKRMIETLGAMVGDIKKYCADDASRLRTAFQEAVKSVFPPQQLERRSKLVFFAIDQI